MIKCFIFSIVMAGSLTVYAQQSPSTSAVWVADLGNGFYKNPILHADYSDPDVCRVDSVYYMVSSSFNVSPGLPILKSTDLVNWTIIGHALARQKPFKHFEKPQHGNGVWAPAIRFHKNEFYIYYPDPDFGIYLTKASNPEGPWSEAVLVESGKGLIDPCPLWDDDGKVYLAHAYAGSRAGIKSIIVIKEMNKEGSSTLDAGAIVYDGHEVDPTIEGPKLHKRNNYYYIFAPAGGVSTGWQVVLRARNIYGPYERKIVMDQGTTSINGPHQGAWIDTTTGEDWFIHFQDKDAYGRIVHLQPMKWMNDWPVIGVDRDGDGKGEPVDRYKKPNVGKVQIINTPADSDEFNGGKRGLQWQWHANPKATWSFPNTTGTLRLYAARISDSVTNYWQVPNLLLQKFPSEEFTSTTLVTFKPNGKIQNEKAGLMVMGQRYAYLALKSVTNGVELVFVKCNNAMSGGSEEEKVVVPVNTPRLYLRVTIRKQGKCTFGYSLDGKKFTDTGHGFQAAPGKWIGAKVGIFCTGIMETNDAGYADFDWFRIEKVNN